MVSFKYAQFQFEIKNNRDSGLSYVILIKDDVPFVFFKSRPVLKSSFQYGISVLHGTFPKKNPLYSLSYFSNISAFADQK